MLDSMAALASSFVTFFSLFQKPGGVCPAKYLHRRPKAYCAVRPRDERLSRYLGLWISKRSLRSTRWNTRARWSLCKLCFAACRKNS
jgi:hypothetical protein